MATKTQDQAKGKPKLEAVTGPQAIPVTVDNFKRAETDMYFTHVAIKEDSLGKFRHRREMFSVDEQTVVRGNRDTLYSSGVFDFDAGAVTITLPDSGKRFMSLMIVNEDHYIVDVKYAPGTFSFNRDQVGTRYALIAMRTLADPNNPEDMKEAHALQDNVKVDQKEKGKFEVPLWEQTSQKKVRDALIVLGSTLPDFRNSFGKKNKVDPIRHLISTAVAWGGNPDEAAVYLNITPGKNDGKTIYKLVVKDVPVDAFWSVSVYNAEGYFEKNSQNAYTLNSLTAKKEADGSVKIQFGGCDADTANCFPIVEGWNYTVRLYRPRPEILGGKWKFPDPQPVES